MFERSREFTDSYFHTFVTNGIDLDFGSYMASLPVGQGKKPTFENYKVGPHPFSVNSD